MRWPFLLCALVTLTASTLSAQDAVVSRNVNLRNDPSSQNQEIRLLIPGEELFILSPTQQNDYYNVRTMANEVGWAYSPRIRLLPPPVGVFDGCPMEGNATRSDTQERNRQKNRATAPPAGDINNAITLEALLQSGRDDERFQEEDGATIRGFVFDVKAGGVESVNCGATTVASKDSHIELTLNATDTDATRRFIVEVTPRWRDLWGQQGTDWSNRALIDLLEGNCAEFTGWMFWDAHHRGDAENTDPGAGDNWRATAWELHPVTAIRVVPC